MEIKKYDYNNIEKEEHNIVSNNIIWTNYKTIININIWTKITEKEGNILNNLDSHFIKII